MAMQPFPTLGIITSFGRSPFYSDPATPISYDLTPRLIAVTTASGRGADDRVTQPGDAVFTFDNSDRVLDPFNASSPLAGYLERGVTITLTATWAGTTYDIWSGFVRDWPQSSGSASMATVDVPCTDIVGVLATASVPWTSVWDYQTGRNRFPAPDQRLAWYRLGETEGNTMADSSRSGFHGRYMGASADTSATDGLIDGDENGAQQFDITTQWGRAIATTLGSSAGARRVVEFWFQGDPRVDAAIGDYNMVSVGNNTVDGRLGLWWNDLLGLVVRYGANSAYCPDFYTTDLRFRHHVWLDWDRPGGATIPTLYINGVARTLTTLGAVDPYKSNGGIRIGDTVADETARSTIVFDEVVVWANPTDDPLDRYNQGTGLWATGWFDRLTLIMEAAGLGQLAPFTVPPVTTPRAYVLGIPDFSADALEQIQSVEQSQQGRLVTERDGLKPRLNMIEYDPAEGGSGTPALVFSDNPTTGTYRYESVTFDTGQAFALTSVQVNYVGAAGETPGFVTRDNVALQNKIGSSSPLVVDASLSQDDAGQLAEYLMFRWGGGPVSYTRRIPSLELNPAAHPVLWPILLAAKLGDRVQVTCTPQNVGSAIVLDGHLDGISHEIDDGANTWRTTYNITGAFRDGSGNPIAWALWGTSVWDTGRWTI